MKTQTTVPPPKATSPLMMSDAPTPSPGKRRDSPGRQYIDTYLSDHLDEFNFDSETILSMIDNGALTICPTCHFLDTAVHNSRFTLYGSFIPGLQPAEHDGCPICAFLPHCRRNLFKESNPDQSDLDSAAENLSRARTHHAATLFQLWMSVYEASASLLFAAMAEGMDALGWCTSPAPDIERSTLNSTDVEKAA